MNRIEKIAMKLVASDSVSRGDFTEARAWETLKRGDYIRSSMGEGYVVWDLPNGDVVINMKKRAQDGSHVSKSDATAVWNNKTNRWDKIV